MARYYLDNDFTISGIVPGSVVGVWLDDGSGRTDTDNQVFLERVDAESVSIPTPSREGQLLIRIRKYDYRFIEVPMYLQDCQDGILQVRQLRDL